MGFSSGRIVEADEPSYCVFVPSSPNPITGRLYFDFGRSDASLLK